MLVSTEYGRRELGEVGLTTLAGLHFSNFTIYVGCVKSEREANEMWGSKYLRIDCCGLSSNRVYFLGFVARSLICLVMITGSRQLTRFCPAHLSFLRYASETTM